MSQVWVVTTGPYYELEVADVFTTRELAEAWVAQVNAFAGEDEAASDASEEMKSDRVEYARSRYRVEEHPRKLDPSPPQTMAEAQKIPGSWWWYLGTVER